MSGVSDLAQAYWEARAVMGFDNDGNPTPAALVHPSMAELMKRDAEEMRRDYDAACDENAALLERIAALEGDAARYRWLRAATDADWNQGRPFIARYTGGGFSMWTGERADAAIDAALASAGRGE